jgi:dTDP-4-amino-4,6-dideoxygalactose transaminase
VLPVVPDWAGPAWHLYTVRTPHRDALQRHLADRGIGTMIHYPIAPHMQKAYAELGFAPGAFPISEAIHNEILSLPMGPHLDENQVAEVCSAIRTFTQRT